MLNVKEGDILMNTASKSIRDGELVFVKELLKGKFTVTTRQGFSLTKEKDYFCEVVFLFHKEHKLIYLNNFSYDFVKNDKNAPFNAITLVGCKKVRVKLEDCEFVGDVNKLGGDL